MYIPYVEQRVTSLRTLANCDMDHNITGMLKIEHEYTKVDMLTLCTRPGAKYMPLRFNGLDMKGQKLKR